MAFFEIIENIYGKSYAVMKKVLKNKFTNVSS